MDSFSFQCPKSRSSDYALYWINRCGISEPVAEEFDIQREHAYPYCVIHYITGGEGSLFYKGREYSLKVGQLFILDAYEAHRYKTDSVQKLSIDWIEFSGGDALKLVRLIIDAHSPIVSMPVSKICDRYLLKIFSLLKKDGSRYSVLISELIYKILLTILFTDNNAFIDEFSENSPEFIQKVTGYIATHLNDDLSVEKLSKLCSFNTSYFTRLFHKTMGVTPAKYVLEKRIEKAKKLLIDSDQPVELISDNLWFCNASHFIRVFKKAEGMTPAEYRKQGLFYKMYRI